MSTQVDDLLLLLVSMQENSWGCWGVNLKLSMLAATIVTAYQKINQAVNWYQK